MYALLLQLTATLSHFDFLLRHGRQLCLNRGLAPAPAGADAWVSTGSRSRSPSLDVDDEGADDAMTVARRCRRG